MHKLFLSFLILLLLAGCNQTADENKKIAELEGKIAEISHLKSELEELKSAHLSLVIDQSYINAKTANINLAAIFNPSAKGYTPISTTAGTLLISLANIKKYADGYKVTFDIGNLTLATFVDADVLVLYGKPYSKDQNYIEWKKNLKQVNIQLNKKMLPAVWNRVSVVLSPAAEQDLGYIEFSLLPNKLYLSRDLRKSAEED